MRPSCRLRVRAERVPPGEPARLSLSRGAGAVRRAAGWIWFRGAACAMLLVAGCTATPVPPFDPPTGMTPEKLALSRPERDVCGSAHSWVSRVFAEEEWACEERNPDARSPVLKLLNRPTPRAQFWRACRAHDICYWTPGVARSVCDDAFFTDLVTECDAAFSPPLPVGETSGVKRILKSLTSSDWVVGTCRQNCRDEAALYRDAVGDHEAGEESFHAAQREAAAVLAALGRVLGAGKMSAITDRLAYLIGEACYTVNRDGICDVDRAVERIIDRVTEVDRRCHNLGQPLESCAVYHCGGFEAVRPGWAATAAEKAGSGCAMTCDGGVLVSGCG